MKKVFDQSTHQTGEKDQQFSFKATLKESCGVVSGKKNRKQRILD